VEELWNYGIVADEINVAVPTSIADDAEAMVLEQQEYMAEDFCSFFVDKGATKQILVSTDARVQFRDSSEHEQVAIFSPTGINPVVLTKACGNAFQ